MISQQIAKKYNLKINPMEVFIYVAKSGMKECAQVIKNTIF